MQGKVLIHISMIELFLDHLDIQWKWVLLFMSFRKLQEVWLYDFKRYKVGTCNVLIWSKVNRYDLLRQLNFQCTVINGIFTSFSSNNGYLVSAMNAFLIGFRNKCLCLQLVCNGSDYKDNIQNHVYYASCS